MIQDTPAMKTSTNGLPIRRLLALVVLAAAPRDVHVIEPGAELNEIAVNELGETLMAPPAI